MGRKLGRGLRPLLWEGLGPHLTQSRLDWGLPPCQVPSWSIQPFGHNKHGRRFLGREVRGPHLTQNRLGQGILHTKLHVDPCSHLIATDMGRKLGRGAVPLWEGGAGSPTNTMWPGLRLTSMPSFILIDPTIWPQYTNATDRTDRQTMVPWHRVNRFTNGHSKMSTSQSVLSDTLWLGSKGRYGSFHLWINVWVAGKTVWSPR